MEMKGYTNTFRIRAYGRTELAQLYNPNLTPQSAWNKLRAWIDHYPGLWQKLAGMGYCKKSRTWTPAQVAAIIDALGEP